MKKNKGFTLIEMVVVLAILGIVLGTTTLSIMGVFKAKTDLHSQTLYDYAVEARQKHLAYAGRYYINLTVVNNTCRLDLIMAEKNIAGVETFTTIKTHMIKDGTKILYSTDGINYTDLVNKSIIFKGNGSTQSGGGYYKFVGNSSAKEKVVYVSPITGKAVYSE